jgi:hypothetical protein
MPLCGPSVCGGPLRIEVFLYDSRWTSRSPRHPVGASRANPPNDRKPFRRSFVECEKHGDWRPRRSETMNQQLFERWLHL